MGERALGWGLRLLGLALAIGPFIVALGMYNWDIKAAVLPSEKEMAEVRETLGELVGGEENLSFGDLENTNTTLRLTAEFTSPFKLLIKITGASVSVSEISQPGVQVTQLQMGESEVEVRPSESVTLTLSGSYKGGSPADFQVDNGIITLELYGVTIQRQIGVGGGP